MAKCFRTYTFKLLTNLARKAWDIAVQEINGYAAALGIPQPFYLPALLGDIAGILQLCFHGF